jgi:hypothetical protein
MSKLLDKINVISLSNEDTTSYGNGFEEAIKQVTAAVKETESKKLFAKTNHPKYKGIYPVSEFIGSVISLNVNGATTDFRIHEITQFCNEDGTNYYNKFE